MKTFVLLIAFFLSFKCFSQSHYKFSYKFSLSAKQVDSSNKIALPSIFIIHSKRKMNAKKIDAVKKCIEENQNNPNNCNKKNLFYVTIEI